MAQPPSSGPPTVDLFSVGRPCAIVGTSTDAARGTALRIAEGCPLRSAPPRGLPAPRHVTRGRGGPMSDQRPRGEAGRRSAFHPAAAVGATGTQLRGAPAMARQRTPTHREEPPARRRGGVALRAGGEGGRCTRAEASRGRRADLAEASRLAQRRQVGGRREGAPPRPVAAEPRAAATAAAPLQARGEPRAGGGSIPRSAAPTRGAPRSSQVRIRTGPGRSVATGLTRQSPSRCVRRRPGAGTPRR